MKNPLLQRYWLTFDPALEFGIGAYGVTAYSVEDAVELLRDVLKNATPKPTVVRLVTSLSELDQGHVVPNMHPFVDRGVWYPKLTPYS